MSDRFVGHYKDTATWVPGMARPYRRLTDAGARAARKLEGNRYRRMNICGFVFQILG